MSILASLFKRFAKRKPEPPIRRAAEPMSSLSKILDGWEPQPDPEPSKPATSPERIADLCTFIPSWGKEVGDPRFSLLYLCFDNEIVTKEAGWYIKNAITPEIAKTLTPETVKQAEDACKTFPISPGGFHHCPPGFIIPPAK
jgi:hypothetical protein